LKKQAAVKREREREK